MKRITTLILLLSLLVLSGTNNKVFATKHTILVSNFSFTPSNLPNVSLGDTIRWQWVSGFHTTTSSSVPAGAQSWDVLISSSNPVYEYKPAVAGTYNYVCTPHAAMGMVGSFVVTGAVQLPDLVIQSPSATPATVLAGSSTQASCSVANTGSGNAGSSTLRYYLSSNNLYDVSDQQLGTMAIGSIPAGSSSPQSLSLTIPANTGAGNWFIIFYADATNTVSESNESNNTGSVQITVTTPLPDLVIQAPGALPVSIVAGNSIQTSCTVANTGNGSAGNSTLQIYLSSNNSYNVGDVSLGSTAVGQIAAGSNSPQSLTVTIPAGTTPGNWYILFYVDGNQNVTESNENNNVSSVQISVTLAMPDLVVVSPLADPEVLLPGSASQLSCSVSNTGTGNAGSTYLYCYFSNTGSFNPDDLILGFTQIGSLSGGAEVPVNIPVTIPADAVPGNYFLIFYADAFFQVTESNETNNAAVLPIAVNAQGNSLGGVVSYQNNAGTPIPNVTVTLRNTQNEIIATSVTNSAGFYSFTGVPDGSYTIKATTTNAWGGVNADDALATLKHFVGISYLSGLKLIAANVDGNSFVNSLDALSIARRFVGLLASFPTGDWYFQSPLVNLVGDGSLTQNLKGICMGDCNGSNPGSGFRPSPSVNQVYAGSRRVRAGQEVLIPVSVNRSVSLGALSLILQYNEKEMNVRSIIPSESCNNLIYNVMPAEIRVAAYSLTPMIFTEGDPVFWLDAIILADNLLDKDIALVLNGNSSVSDAEGNVLESVDFQLPQLKVATGAVKHIITQVNMSFSPQALTGVLAGDTIDWVWTSGFHTTTSAVIPSGAASWDAVLSSSSPVFTYIPTKTGTYDYVCTPHASLGMTGSFTVSGAVGIGYIYSSGSDISIYPNPVEDECRITFNAANAVGGKIKIFNLAGQEVMETPVVSSDNSNEIVVNIRAIQSGTYFVQFIDSKSNIVKTTTMVKR